MLINTTVIDVECKVSSNLDHGEKKKRKKKWGGGGRGEGEWKGKEREEKEIKHRPHQ